MPSTRRVWAAVPLAVMVLLLAACQSGPAAPSTSTPPADPPVTTAPAPSDSPEPSASPEPSGEASTPTAGASDAGTADTGTGPDPVGQPAPPPPPTPTSCADIDAAPLAEDWRAEGYTLEPFDGTIVRGSFPPADDNGGTLAVHCILWTAERATGPHVLVELYRGADAAAVVQHPSLDWCCGTTLLATAHGDIELWDSGGMGSVSSQETVGGHDDVVLRLFTVGMPFHPEMDGAHVMVLLFESVFGKAPPMP